MKWAGRVVGTNDRGGWGFQRWQDESPLVDNLVSKSEAFKLRHALSAGWSSVTLTWLSGHTVQFDLTEYWHRRVTR